MKACMICGASAPLDAITCAGCGEATWSQVDAPLSIDTPKPIPVEVVSNEPIGEAVPMTPRPVELATALELLQLATVETDS